MYVRFTDSFGYVQVQLLTAKSWVASVKKLTFHRLELNKIQLLSELHMFIGKPHSAHFWSDSQIVLHYFLQHHTITATRAIHHLFLGLGCHTCQVWDYLAAHLTAEIDNLEI